MRFFEWKCIKDKWHSPEVVVDAMSHHDDFVDFSDCEPMDCDGVARRKLENNKNTHETKLIIEVTGLREESG